MVLFKVSLILLIAGITIPIISGLPNIVLILLDDVDIQLTGLKVCYKFVDQYNNSKQITILGTEQDKITLVR